jgi:flagellar motor switch protein FliM
MPRSKKQERTVPSQPASVPVPVESPPASVEPWDFRRTTRFSAEAMRGVRRLFDHWGSLIQTTLGPSTRLSVETQELRVDALSYEEYSRHPLDQGVVATLEERTRFGAPVQLRVDENLALVLLDRELGGPGVLVPRGRPFSPLELSVLRHPLETIVKLVEEVIRLQMPQAALELVRTEGTDRAQTGTLATEAILWIRQRMLLAGVEGQLHLVVPYTAIEPVLPMLSGERGADDEAVRAAPVLRPFIGLRRVRAEARLGPATLSAREVAGLRPGDVVALNVRVGQGFWMTVEGRPAFLVHDIGRVGIRTAVRVAQQLPSSFLTHLADPGKEDRS